MNYEAQFRSPRRRPGGWCCTLLLVLLIVLTFAGCGSPADGPQPPHPTGVLVKSSHGTEQRLGASGWTTGEACDRYASKEASGAWDFKAKLCVMYRFNGKSVHVWTYRRDPDFVDCYVNSAAPGTGCNPLEAVARHRWGNRRLLTNHGYGPAPPRPDQQRVVEAVMDVQPVEFEMHGRWIHSRNIVLAIRVSPAGAVTKQTLVQRTQVAKHRKWAVNLLVCDHKLSESVLRFPTKRRAETVAGFFRHHGCSTFVSAVHPKVKVPGPPADIRY